MTYPLRTIGDFFRIKHGYAFKGEYFANAGSHVLLTPGNFEASGGLKHKGEREKYYQGEFPEDFLLKRGDLLIAMTDLTQNAPILGSPAVIPSDNSYLHNQRLGKVINLKATELDQGFLYYLLSFPGVRAQIKASATGATVRHTAPDRIYAVSAPIPPVGTQRRIASILSAYDDLIENNTRRIAILEEMARRIYEEWFVHFRFPGHEQVKMVESELGLIPEGWKVTAASDAITINPKVRVPKEGLKPFLPMGSLAEQSMLISNVEERTGNSGSKFQNGDTLFARITPCLENGKTGFVQFLPSNDAVAFGSTEFIVLRSRTLCAEYVYALARSEAFRANAIKSMSGATGRQRVREACFDNFLLAQPDSGTLKRFGAIAQPMFRMIQTLAKKNTNLRTTRDLLLPKLISGELDVSTLPEFTRLTAPEEAIAA